MKKNIYSSILLSAFIHVSSAYGVEAEFDEKYKVSHSIQAGDVYGEASEKQGAANVAAKQASLSGQKCQRDQKSNDAVATASDAVENLVCAKDLFLETMGYLPKKHFHKLLKSCKGVRKFLVSEEQHQLSSSAHYKQCTEVISLLMSGNYSVLLDQNGHGRYDDFLISLGHDMAQVTQADCLPIAKSSAESVMNVRLVTVDELQEYVAERRAQFKEKSAKVTAMIEASAVGEST